MPAIAGNIMAVPAFSYPVGNRTIADTPQPQVVKAITGKLSQSPVAFSLAERVGAPTRWCYRIREANMSDPNEERSPAAHPNWGWIVGVCAAVALFLAVIYGVGHRHQSSSIRPDTTAGQSTPRPGAPTTNR